MTSFLRPALSALVVGSVIFGSYPGHAQQQTLSMAGYPAVGAPAVVKLLAPGTAPMTRLRYKVPAGQKMTMLMTATMGMNISMGGQAMPAMDMPAMKMTSELASTNVAATGDISYDIAFTGMTAESAPGADPTLAAVFSGAMDVVKSIKGSAVISDRGVKRSSQLNLDSITDATVKQALQSFTGSIENVAVPLPEEAVGPGAKWEVRMSTSAAGMTAFQKTEYELVSVSGNTVMLRVKSEQIAPPQAMNNPALPAGMTMQVEKMSGAGSGTITLNLASLVPTSEMSQTMDASISMDMGGQAQAMGMSMKMKTSVAPGK
jgi:Family of unknown function (DUF6263)